MIMKEIYYMNYVVQMEMLKNIMMMENQNLKVNIKMGIGMVKEKNIIMKVI